MKTVERLARAFGVWWGEPGTLGYDEEHAAWGEWTLSPCTDGSFTIRKWTLVEPRTRQAKTEQRVKRPAAVLVLLAYARKLTVDMGPCSSCEGMRHIHWGNTGDVHVRGWLPGGAPTDYKYRPCPSCSPCAVDGQPTGRDVRPLVRVLLDSMPRDARRDERGDSFRLMGNGYAMPVVSGDAASRNALAVKADELAQAGDPLAEPLAAFLSGECRTCEGSCLSAVARVGARRPNDKLECQPCNGHGTMLGALAPTLEGMAEAEWLARVTLCAECRGLQKPHPTSYGPFAEADGSTNFVLLSRSCPECEGKGWMPKESP